LLGLKGLSISLRKQHWSVPLVRYKFWRLWRNMIVLFILVSSHQLLKAQLWCLASVARSPPAGNCERGVENLGFSKRRVIY
jgi:hypothetical protein